MNSHCHNCKDTAQHNVELEEENKRYVKEMRNINNGIPSEWAYAILQKQHDNLESRCQKLEAAISEVLSQERSRGYPTGGEWIRLVTILRQALAHEEKK